MGAHRPTLALCAKVEKAKKPSSSASHPGWRKKEGLGMAKTKAKAKAKRSSMTSLMTRAWLRPRRQQQRRCRKTNTSSSKTPRQKSLLRESGGGASLQKSST